MTGRNFAEKAVARPSEVPTPIQSFHGMVIAADRIIHDWKHFRAIFSKFNTQFQVYSPSYSPSLIPSYILQAVFGRGI